MTHAVEGELVDAASLQVVGAQQVRDAAGMCPWAELVETRSRTVEGRHEEVVVIDVEPELPQVLVHDIRSVERLAVAFGERGGPAVTALRDDFPRVPHLNWTRKGDPKCLCLYEDPWSEVRLRWSGPGFLRDVIGWLSRTAVADLHQPDQQLEPLIFESANEVVFPQDIFDESAGEKVFSAQVIPLGPGLPYTLKLQETGEAVPVDARRLYCAATVASPTAQEAMRDCPRDMKELSSLLGDVGVDLWEAISSRLVHWYSATHPPRDDDGVVALVRLPRQRVVGGAVESVQHLAFELHPIKELAMASGRLGSHGANGPLVPLVGEEVNKDLAAFVRVVPLRAIECLDRRTARLVSGLEAAEHEPYVVLVGVGALGSRIHENLSSMGWGRWTLVDKDTLLPHNVARHRLGEHFVGLPKAWAVAETTRLETPHNAVEQAFIADAQAPKANEDLRSAYRNADLILDASTSIAVARSLARDLDSAGRRASLFVNPTGRDAVLLMEDAGRSTPLDALEAQYYRAVLCDERLVDHISTEAGVRYGAGCRDVAARLAQDDLALASSLLCRQIRTTGTDAAAVVWRMERDGSVHRIDIPVAEVTRHTQDEWELVLDHGVLAHAAEYRRQRLPKETGGVLIGYFDMQRKTVYVVDALPAPRDSVEHRTTFVRGYAGLREQLASIGAQSGGQVGYVGEWHSHPDGAGVSMSTHDGVLLATIAAEMQLDGSPGVMLIVGGDGTVGFYTQAH